MKILCLYNNQCALELFEWIESQGHEIIIWSERLDMEWCKSQCFDLTVSYTYRFILPPEILEILGNNAVNIHNAYLPWNRGADPNIWSILDNTPRGVTLHYMGAGLDRGDIIAQQLVVDGNDGETLSSTYARLDRAAKQLFKDAFSYYSFWEEMRKEPLGGGSYHRHHEIDKMRKYFDSYNIDILELRRRLKGTQRAGHLT